MLTTLLNNKLKGGKWHALIGKVYAPLNLYTAAFKVTGKKKAAEVDGDGQRWEAFEEYLLARHAISAKSRKLSPQSGSSRSYSQTGKTERDASAGHSDGR